MKAKQIDSYDGRKTFVLVFDPGDEVASVLREYARASNISAAHFTAIGACNGVTLGYLEEPGSGYKKIPVKQQVEVASMMGNITLDENGEPKVHAHMVIGLSDGSAMSGHLLEAHVRPTLEMILVESEVVLRRRFVAEVGMAVIRFD